MNVLKNKLNILIYSILQYYMYGLIQTEIITYYKKTGSSL